MPDWLEVHKQTFDLGVYLLEVTLTLGGGFVQITPPHGSTILSVDQDGYRAEVRNYMGDYFSGIRINGMTGGIAQSPISIGTIWGNEFHTMEVRAISPTTYAHIGRATLSMELPTDWGDAKVTGAFGYQLTFEIHLKVPLPERVAERAWYEKAWDFVDEHAEEILVGAVVVAVIVVVPEAAPGLLRLAF